MNTEEQLPLIDARIMSDWSEDLEPDDVRAVLAQVPEEAGKCITELRQAIAGNDLRAAKRTAHRLKGMAGNLGAARLAQAARRVEVGSTSIEEVSAQMPVLQATLNETIQAMGLAGA